MNRPTDYDGEFCGRVPLNQTNMIQPHGVLLIIDRKSRNIIQVSDNVTALFGQGAPQMVNSSLAQYLSAGSLQVLEDCFATGLPGKIPLTLDFQTVAGAQQLLVTVKAEPLFYVLEVETASRDKKGADNFLDIYQQLKYTMAEIEASTTADETCSIALRELKRISGFDKLMVYRFDADWNGTVIAEIMEPGMESYLGLKFPASDIPKQARELYRTSPYRLIPDVNYEPVRLYPVLNPLTNAFTDLSDSNLRSVAAVHLEYLRNMNVTASMSTRILKEGQLWGLIACHHRTPRYLSFEQCALFELLSNVISSRIAVMEQSDLAQFRAGRNSLYTRLVEGFYRDGDLSYSFQREQSALLDLLGASGLVLVVDGKAEVFGQTPSAEEAEDLVVWLRTHNVLKTVQYPSLSAIFDSAEAYTEKASGLLVLPVQPERETYVLAFRPEAVRQVDWGGNPNEAINFAADGKQYHPRNSFRLWQETVRKTALPWKVEEVEVAEHFRNFIVEFVLNKIYG